MNFDFILKLDQDSLNRKLVYFHTQCPLDEMWTTKQYRKVIQLLRQRADASSDFIRDWIDELRYHSLYD